MNARIATIAREDDDFSYCLKTQSQRFGFLMSTGVSPQSDRFPQWRKIELALYDYLGTACAKRKQILADRLQRSPHCPDRHPHVWRSVRGAYPFRMDFGLLH